MSIDCFSRDGQKYELVPEEDPSDAVVSNGGGGGAMRGVHREVRLEGLSLFKEFVMRGNVSRVPSFWRYT